MIMLVWSFWTFLNNLPFIENGGIAYRDWYLKSCWMNLLLHFEGLAARRYIVAVGGKVWKETGPIMTSLNNFKFFWKQLGKVFICCCPGNFEIPSLLFDCSDRVYILLSNTFSTLWNNHKFLSRFRSNICTEFLACLISQRERERESCHVVYPWMYQI